MGESNSGNKPELDWLQLTLMQRQVIYQKIMREQKEYLESFKIFSKKSFDLTQNSAERIELCKILQKIILDLAVESEEKSLITIH
jgi:hypothetical protein